MHRTFILIITAVTVVTAKELNAVVHLTPNDAAVKNVMGDIMITQSVPNGPVKLTGKVTGLTPGLHGFHVHEKGDLKEGCKSTGPHFNPENNTHGAPEDTIRHVGDLGNIKANDAGEAVIDITDNIISLSGPNNILGRAIVVHSQEDDLGKGGSPVSNSTGNAGDRWACGIIAVHSASSSFTSSMLIIITSFMIAMLHQMKY